MFGHLIAGLYRRIPSQCAVCHAWPARAVCDGCIRRFGQPVHRCATCACQLPEPIQQCRACLNAPPPLDSTLAAVAYGYPWSDLVVQFKFHAHPGWAGTLAALMRSTPWVEPTLDAADYVVPMPLSVLRLRTRGFNQAQLLARELAPRKLRTDLLLRIKESPPQSSLSRAERLTNVRNAYALEPSKAHEVSSKRIVLVDDVMTTGASLHAAAQTLRRFGAAHITALVFARAE